MEHTKKSRWNWLKSFPLIIAIPIIVILFISITYLVIFVVKFAGNGISSDPKDWSDTATFMNLIVSILNLIVFAVLSLLVYRYNISKDTSADAFQQAVERPILVFREEPGVYSIGNINYSGWVIKNIGNGPALNLLVTFKTERNRQWTEPVAKCYSIGKDEEIVISWIRGADVTVVVYKDIFGNEFGSVLVDDLSFVENLNEPTSKDPFQLGITANSLKTIFTMTSQRKEDILTTPYSSTIDPTSGTKRE